MIYISFDGLSLVAFWYWKHNTYESPYDKNLYRFALSYISALPYHRTRVHKFSINRGNTSKLLAPGGWHQQVPKHWSQRTILSIAIDLASRIWASQSYKHWSRFPRMANLNIIVLSRVIDLCSRCVSFCHLSGFCCILSGNCRDVYRRVQKNAEVSINKLSFSAFRPSTFVTIFQLPPIPCGLHHWQSIKFVKFAESWQEKPRELITRGTQTHSCLRVFISSRLN